MIAHSRLVWEYATGETDHDREWIPNAKQTSLTPLTVNQALIDAWAVFLDEAEAVLNGEKLLPHWRVSGARGINLKRVFTEPRRFDFVLWLQGAAGASAHRSGLPERQVQRGFDDLIKLSRSWGRRQISR
jgi:hypothetical protein